MIEELKPTARAGFRRFRRATSRLRLLPRFLIIGTQPAGTLPLLQALRRHPDIVGPWEHHENAAWSRELHFFDQGYWRGVNWYRSLFPAAALRSLARRRGRDLVPGEATASYLFHPAVPERVAETILDARFIALLRDPIERAFWSYEAMRLRGDELLSFEEALAAEPERVAAEEAKRQGVPNTYRLHAYTGRGLYAEQLERWLAFFPRDQFLVLRAEDFISQPAEVYPRILEFLEVRPWRPRRFPVPEWQPARIEPALRSALEARFAESNARLKELFGPELSWERAPDAAAPKS